MIRPRGRPKAARTKVPVSLRIDADTLQAWKATGKGWQTRMAECFANRRRVIASDFLLVSILPHRAPGRDWYINCFPSIVENRMRYDSACPCRKFLT